MKATQFTLTTLKETPSDAEIISHQLLIKGGFIRKLASGIYSWMPLGLRVLRKVETIVRQEMDRSGAQELLMPVTQPAELWQESGRWQLYDEGLLLKFKDRHDREFCLGPTHEEVITDIARAELRSHKQLPVNYYQIQTKFRDETRPRFGVLRAREFIMKDAYSFHASSACLQETFDVMHATYERILNRMALDFRAVDADSGSIGGSASTEFHVLADSGEDRIAFGSKGRYAANIELAEALTPEEQEEPLQPMRDVPTPNQKTIADVVAFLNIDITKTLKTLVVRGKDTPLVALVLRGDHTLNPLKAAKTGLIAEPMTLATEADIASELGCKPGSIGPIDLKCPIIVDRAASVIKNFTCGANQDHLHFANANWVRDAALGTVADLRNIEIGDPAPNDDGTIEIRRGIEVGHIFQLGNKYSAPLKATVLDAAGKSLTMLMGCYGIGVSRLVGAAIEQNHDDKGIIWPASIAPFEVILIPINAHKSEAVQAATDSLYNQLCATGVEVLLDDRDQIRPGAKFADAELLGFPHRIVIGDRALADGAVEYTDRATGSTEAWPVEAVVQRLVAHLRTPS
jgi:prolyl-tRNA synthetase